MKYHLQVKLDYNIIFHLVMLYPLVLAVITAFGKEAFFITAPYFTLIMVLMSFIVLFRNKISLKPWELIQMTLIGILLLLTIYNFSSVRYSLPLVFVLYLFILQLFLSKYSSTVHYSDFRYFKQYLYLYVFLSIFFIVVPLSPSQKIFRFDGFLGSPTVYSAYLVLLYILALPQFKKIKYKVLWYFIVLLFVYLSKTRLVLILIIFLPVLYLAVDLLRLSIKRIFLATFLILLFVYPAYKVVVDYFPNLVTLRYEEGKDRSYDLRFYLYSITQEDFFKQDLKTKVLGQGNEHSRLFIKDKLSMDIFPHNDFIRVVSDWGLLGAFFFFLIIYRYGVRSKVALMIAIIYLIQFYSNLVFNMFLVSILVMVSTLSHSQEDKPDKNYRRL